MSRASHAKPRQVKRKPGHYVLRLFMAGEGPNSLQALANLRRLCEEHLQGRCTIETVDVLKNFEAAVHDNVLITPTLILVSPRPRVIVMGNLSDRQKLLVALRLSEGDS